MKDITTYKWAARDADGSLWVYISKPVNDNGRYMDDHTPMKLDKKHLPELKVGDAPVMVDIQFSISLNLEARLRKFFEENSAHAYSTADLPPGSDKVLTKLIREGYLRSRLQNKSRLYERNI